MTVVTGEVPALEDREHDLGIKKSHPNDEAKYHLQEALEAKTTSKRPSSEGSKEG